MQSKTHFFPKNQFSEKNSFRKYLLVVLSVLSVSLVSISVQARQPVPDSLVQWLDSDQQFDTSRVLNLIEISGWLYRSYPDSSIVYSREALTLSEGLNYIGGIARANQRLGGAHFTKQNYDSATIYFERSLEANIERNHEQAIATINASLGAVYASQAKFDLAIERFLDAIPSFESVGNTNAVVVMYNNIGNIFLEQELLENALTYYERALETLGDPQDPLNSMVKSNTALVLYDLGRYDEAIDYAEQGIENALEYERLIHLPGLYQTLGNIYRDLGRYEESIKNYGESLDYNTRMGRGLAISEIKFEISTLEVKLDRYHQAKEHLDEIIASIESGSIERINFEQKVYKLAAEVEYRLGYQVSAYNYLALSSELSDSLHQEEMSLKISELETIYETEKKEAQIQLLEIENQVANLRSTNIAVVSIVILLAVIIGFWYYYRRKAEEKKRRIDSMKKELHQFGLVIAEKNKFISKFREDLEEVRQHVRTLEGRKELSSLVDSIHHNANLTEDEEELFTKIEQVNAGFFAGLRARNSELTSNEERLATLVQMGLSNKDIANILHIEPDSVKQAKRRLKRKLQLDGEADLGDHLKSLVA